MGQETFGDNAAMVEDLYLAESLGPSSRFELDEFQAAEMKCVLDAFIRVHKAAGATSAKGGVALLDLSQRVIMVVLNEIKFGKERGLRRNIPWVITQLRSGMDDVDNFVENISRERPTVVWRFLYKFGVVGDNPPLALFEQCDVTLRGILAVVKSRDALPKLSVALSGMDIALTIPEEPKDPPMLPLPWDAYDLAQSLHDFAEQLGRRQVRAVPGDELQRPDGEVGSVQQVFPTTNKRVAVLRCELGSVGRSTREHLQQPHCHACC